MRYLWTLLLMISVGLLSWGAAQSARPDLFDLKKSQQELEVMKGILTTTLNFFLKESRKASTQKGERDETQLYKDFTFQGPWGGSRVSAFYLYGQGATFIIPVSALRYGKAPAKVGALDADQLKLNAELDALQAFQLEEQIATEQQFEAELAQLELNRVAEAQEQELAKLQTELTFLFAGVPGGVGGGIPGGVGGGIPGGVRGPAKARPKPSKPVAQAAPAMAQAAPQPPQAPQPAAEPRSPQREEEVRKKLEDLQRNVVKRREMVEVQRKELLERLAQIKLYLIEALANHGDSLTHVKPNEYINLVLTAEDGDSKWFKLADSEDASPHREIMSVQKSVITDYKAGRLTLDTFKQKVMQYNN